MKREIVRDVLVRLTAPENEALEMHQRPGEAAAETVRRVLVETVAVLDVAIEYRKPPLFADWMRQGPMTVLRADTLARQLAARGFEVRVRNTAPRELIGMQPEDDVTRADREEQEREERKRDDEE